LKYLALLVLLPLTAFCAFGLLSTLEPMEAGEQRLWRGIYGGVGIVSIALSVRICRGGPKAREPREKQV